MAEQSRDRELVARLFGQAEMCEYDEDGNLVVLHLSMPDLIELPKEIGQLRHLRELRLRGSRLQNLPDELWQLTKLQELTVYQGRLKQLPKEIGQLRELRELNLFNNRLSNLPAELWTLTKLRSLYLYRNQLEIFPAGIGQLRSLEVLSLSCLKIILPIDIEQLKKLQSLALAGDRSGRLAGELWKLIKLANLRSLHLGGNGLREVPRDLGDLRYLQGLRLSDNKLMEIPRELGMLRSLQRLWLDHNELRTLPEELWNLTRLRTLWLNDNELSEVSGELGKLKNLQELYLHDNKLKEIPREVGELRELRELRLSGNNLTQLPLELGKLEKLKTLDVDNNPNLLTPPPEIVTLGTDKIKEFLRELERDSVVRYESKLLLVGEGGTGKSSLLRLLRDDPFDPHLSTSHGIEVGALRFPHPADPALEITLNTWDFGGQQIYHATHQFFLTRRSLYLVVWNARQGAEAGRLSFWLETIKALAPDSPVLLVATHTDERLPDLNFQLYKDAYPQIVGSFSVSNKDGSGLEELRAAIVRHAAALPLMGQPWPGRWVEAEKALMARREHHIEAKTYLGICARRKVEKKMAGGSLGSYLHDLGKILYFRDDYVLANMVVLKPNWVTKAISFVLEDEVTRQAGGVLTHSELPRIWAHDEHGRPYEPALYPIFLRLMERFDLSYQLESAVPGEPITQSLIPLLLPHQPPDNLPPWPSVPLDGQMQVEMRYYFDFVPAGILSWFIVRTHRYTTNQHWREGVILAYRDHYARVELNPMLRELRLVVWGVQPHTFFTILKDTLDLILARFEGLRVQRLVPCICHWEGRPEQPCKEVYRYEEVLLRRMEAGKTMVECPASFKEISVLKLLYGIHVSTDVQVRDDIRRLREEVRSGFALSHGESQRILQRLEHQSELIARNFLRQWNLEMKKIEAECPGTFLLLPQTKRFFNPKRWIGENYRLQLVCQHPPGLHCVGEGYELTMPKDWWVSFAPWLKRLIGMLKYGVPMGHALGAVVDAVDFADLEKQISLLETIVEDVSDLTLPDTKADLTRSAVIEREQPALRALHAFLDKADPAHDWGGLHRIVTPEGNILWLCAEHREDYEAKPLVL